MRAALQSRDHFGTLQMKNKLISSFKGDEGVRIQCDPGMGGKKKKFSWEKDIGGETKERSISLKLQPQLSSSLLS